MFNFMDQIGWFAMSPAEQWQTALTLLGFVGALGLFWWTIHSWRLTKTIDLENQISQNYSKIHAMSAKMLAIAEGLHSEPDLIDKKQVQGTIDKAKEVTDTIVNKDVPLKVLRTLNKQAIRDLHFLEHFYAETISSLEHIEFQELKMGLRKRET
jgi:hypothetical protein